MRLLAISEHYFPRVGGTVAYLHETLCALANLGVEAELLVPGPAPKNWLPSGMSEPPYSVVWLDCGYPAAGDPTREQRYAFCRAADMTAFARLSGPARPDVLHVLFGMFVMEILDTSRLRRAGLPIVATVHNVPPMECRQTPLNAALPARVKEAMRLRVVAMKNASRLRRHRYDAYVVPSEQVRNLLAPIIGTTNINVIGHGTTGELLRLMSPPTDRRPTAKLRLLTVGGYAPHKRQHLIPATGAALREAGLDFSWDVVGPAGRIKGYYASIQKDVEQRGLSDQITLHQALPIAGLAELYDAANIYVQPSIEEGFCITALDAAAAGLPVIGSKAGALPDIIAASGGILVRSEPQTLATALTQFCCMALWQDAPEQCERVQTDFSWVAAAQTLRQVYRDLTSSAGTEHG